VCEAGAVSGGLCDATIGCQNVSGAGDRALCQTLFDCMRVTRCAVNDPMDCLCGTAAGAACLTGANGACRDETVAATKAASFTEAGARFYDFAYPGGYATQRIACWRDNCGPLATPPNTCPL
jgi:hypothetical protein